MWPFKKPFLITSGITIHSMRTSDLVKRIDAIFQCFTLCTGFRQKFGAWLSKHNQRIAEPGKITCRFLIPTWGQCKGSGICCCMTPQFGREPAAADSLLSPFLLQWHSHRSSRNAEGRINLHPPLCIVLHQTFWLPSVIVRKIRSSQHSVFKMIPQHFLVGRGRSKKTPNNQRKKPL